MTVTVRSGRPVPDEAPISGERPVEAAGRGEAAPGRTLRRIVAGALAASLLVLGGLLLGRVTAPTPPAAPSSTSAEAGFARDMQTHHQQAVEMAMIIQQKSSDPAILTLSYDIATSQAQHAGQMFGWLNTWGLPQAAPEPSMTWMTRPALDASHEHDDDMTHTPGERMPGLATEQQLDDVRNATGADADRIFLELMIAHHQGGVEMAESAIARSRNEVVLSLATGIVTAQQSEIDYMRQLLGA